MIKKIFYIFAFLTSFISPVFCDYDEAEYFYSLITRTPEFSMNVNLEKEKFKIEEYKPNYLFEDIVTTSVESIPFGYFLTMIGIYVYEAANQGTFMPKIKALDDYKSVYVISIGSFTAFTVIFNTLFFYEY
jgi:hypothetical protein